MSLVLPTFSGFVQPAGGGGGSFANTLSGSFDGTDDKLSIPTNTFNLGDGLFSFSLWFNADSLSNYNVLFAIGKASGSTFICSSFIRSNGEIWLSNWSNNQLVSTGNTIATSTWHHLAYVKSTTGVLGTITIYFNGSSVASGPIPSTGSDFGSESEASAIADSITGHYTFDGKIDEFAFWNSALAASDITAIYNSGVPADISSLSPVNWYRMGDGTGDTDSGGGAPASGDTIGTVVNQGSGSNNATGTNGPLYSNSVPRLLFSTKSVEFDGTNDYMTCGSVTQINSVTNLSTSSWFKIDAYQSGGGPIILGGHSVAGSNGFYLQALNATSLRYAHQDYGSFDDFTSLSVPINTWHNVVTVQSGTSLTVYLNGTSVGTATVTAIGSGWGSNFTIGKWSGGNFNFMNGHIDEVALFTSALSSSDVTAIYNSGVPADLSSLSPVGWWRMGDGTEAGSGTTVFDMSTNSNNGTLTNGPTYSSTVPS